MSRQLARLLLLPGLAFFTGLAFFWNRNGTRSASRSVSPLVWPPVAASGALCHVETLARISAEYDAKQSPPGGGCKGDIGEHMETLLRIALDPAVRSVTEVGVRDGYATWAFLEAARRRHIAGGPPLSIRLHDITMSGGARALVQLMQGSCPAIPVTFIEGDDLLVPIKPTDVLLLDTWHSHRQLSRELAIIPPAVRRALILHDTVTFGSVDEAAVGHGGKPVDEALYSGVSRKAAGLQPALDKFLRSRPEWVFFRRDFNCNGLTIVRRRVVAVD